MKIAKQSKPSGLRGSQLYNRVAGELQDTQKRVRGLVSDLAKAGYTPDEITLLVQKHVVSEVQFV